MIVKFYILNGDVKELEFINTPLGDILDQLEARTHWLYVKPVGSLGIAVHNRSKFAEYIRELKASPSSMEVVAYLHTSQPSRLSELEEF